jgi:hypothetical protein
MSSSKRDRHSQAFVLEGQFLGFIQEGYKLKYLRVAIAHEEYQIKLSKESRASVGTVLYPNDWIQICGEQTTERHKERTRFKAYQVTKLEQGAGVGERVSGVGERVSGSGERVSGSGEQGLGGEEQGIGGAGEPLIADSQQPIANSQPLTQVSNLISCTSTSASCFEFN